MKSDLVGQSKIQNPNPKSNWLSLRYLREAGYAARMREYMSRTLDYISRMREYKIEVGEHRRRKTSH